MFEELLQEAGVLILFLAGISYVAVGIYLLQTAAREGGGPSSVLGWSLLFNGVSFGLSEFPFVTGVEEFSVPFTFASRISAAVCCVLIAVFTWRVFRSRSRWAGIAVGLDAAVIAAGLVISAWEGDWEGYSPIAYKGFWFEWVGSVAPFVWLASESIREYWVSRRRIGLGLIDPVVSNRFFLIGLYAALASITYPIYIPMYIIYELHGVWLGSLDVGVGLVEAISLGALWLSFSTPRFYRRWIGASVTHVPKN
jgi:hypothetical protein